MVLYDPARRPRAKPIFTPSTRNMNAIAYRWTREGNLVIPDPVKLERKLPLYFRHQHYYAGGFPEDYSDVFGAPAAALPAF